MNLYEEAEQWVDTKECAKYVVDRFTEQVNANPMLKELRDYVEKTAYGFGERAFYHLWQLLVNELEPDFKFLEIGVYKGQIITCVKMLAPLAKVYGVTLLSNFGGDDTTFPDEDYAQHIINIHAKYNIPLPRLLVGNSLDAEIQAAAKRHGPYDVVYIDGCHDYGYVVQDILNYGPMVKPGGYLVMDDSACHLNQPYGFFQGIAAVSKAVATYIEPFAEWEHLLAVMHLRVWRKVT